MYCDEYCLLEPANVALYIAVVTSIHSNSMGRRPIFSALTCVRTTHYHRLTKANVSPSSWFESSILSCRTPSTAIASIALSCRSLTGAFMLPFTNKHYQDRRIRRSRCEELGSGSIGSILHCQPEHTDEDRQYEKLPGIVRVLCAPKTPNRCYEEEQSHHHGNNRHVVLYRGFGDVVHLRVRIVLVLCTCQ